MAAKGLSSLANIDYGRENNNKAKHKKQNMQQHSQIIVSFIVFLLCDGLVLTLTSCALERMAFNPLTAAGSATLDKILSLQFTKYK